MKAYLFLTKKEKEIVDRLLNFLPDMPSNSFEYVVNTGVGHSLDNYLMMVNNVIKWCIENDLLKEEVLTRTENPDEYIKISALFPPISPWRAMGTHRKEFYLKDLIKMMRPVPVEPSDIQALIEEAEDKVHFCMEEKTMEAIRGKMKYYPDTDLWTCIGSNSDRELVVTHYMDSELQEANG